MATNKQQPAKPAPTVLPDAEFDKKWDQENLYQNIKRANDPRFGEISIVKNNSTNEILFVKEKMASSKNEASNDIRELKSRIALNHPNLQKLVNYSTAVKKELCSTHYLSRGFYEFPRSDTQKEHLERKRNLSGFTSSELTHLAYQILDGLNHLHSRNITHGDIRPLNIGYHKALNQFQILDRLSDPSPLEKLQASNIINKKEIYTAPELWKKLQGKDKTLKYSAYKNDLYALGLSILFLGTSDSVQDIYKPNGEFDQNRLNEHINNFNAKYQGENPYLCTIVKTLLAPNEADRPDSQQFVSNLIPYDQYKAQEAQGIKVQGAVKNQVYSEPPQQDTNNGGMFTYTAPVVHSQVQSQPQNDRVIINRSEHQPQATTEQYKNQGNYSNMNTTQENPNVTYSYQQPNTTYTYTQAPTNDQSYSNTTYTYAQPTTTYSYAQPSYNYVQGEPVNYTQGTTTYVNAEPTYTQNDNVTYSYAQPTTTYSYAQPTTTYSYAQPTTTYTYAQPNTTFVNANIDGSTKIERRSYNTYTAPVERKSYTQYVTGTDGVKRLRASYTQYVVNNGTNPVDQVITKMAPVSYVYAQPTTYVQGTPIIERKSYTQVVPTTTYVQSSPISYVQSTPTYTYSQPTTNYQAYGTPSNVDRKVEGGVQENQSNDNQTITLGQPYTIDANGNKIPYNGTLETQYSQYAPPTEGKRVYSYASPTNYVQAEPKYVSDNVEIRRGSYVPIQVSSEPNVIKKRYIIEGDKVIEVDANENEQQHHY